ncbi:MAG: D-alanine--D-alanine ligase family protein [bacterium]
MQKKTIALLFGGQSSEHEISKISASAIISNLSKELYNIVPIYITKNGNWKMADSNSINIININWELVNTTAIISPDTSHKGIIKIADGILSFIKVDVVIPIIHGKGGEDGTIQGLLELAKIPYVGCGLLSSAMCMDKSYTKIVVDSINITQAKYKTFQKYQVEEILKSSQSEREVFFQKSIKCEIGLPCYIKPANAGSSKGITKALDLNQFFDGLKEAILHDNRVVVEENIIGKEVECGVIGNHDVLASRIGQVLSVSDFYDFDAKYNNKNSKTVIPADLDESTAKKIQGYAIKIFKALDGRGLSRVDFFVEESTNKVIFNEINTFPGFTSISMYPMLLSDLGFDLPDLLNKLIDLAIDDFNKKNKIME